MYKRLNPSNFKFIVNINDDVPLQVVSENVSVLKVNLNAYNDEVKFNNFGTFSTMNGVKII